MNRKEISEKLNKTYKSMISSDFDSVVHKIKNKKGVLLDMNEKESKSMRGLVVSLLAVCILCVGVLVIDKTKQDNNVFATINFDVNPSIEIKINKSSEVIDYSSYNEDGTKILDNMDLKGVKLDVATNAIIGSLYKNGYITSENNSILISVFNEDNSHVELDGIVSEIDEDLNNNNINSSVISQEVKLNDQLKETASKYNVSLGKVKLINRLIEVNPLYNFDDLVKLNTNELNLLINDSKNNVVDVKITAKELKEHKNKDDKSGYWIGFALTAPDGANQVKYTFGDESKTVNLEKNVTLEGDEGILVASRIADRVGITRSVIVNALRKFESAGVIESRSSGMKGTYIKVVNDVIFEELERMKRNKK